MSGRSLEYEVAWQLPLAVADGPSASPAHQPGPVQPPPLGGPGWPHALPAHYSALARVAGQLADADAVGLARLQGGRVIVQGTTDHHGLAVGTVLSPRPECGTWPADLDDLVAGRSPWCRCLPPPGFTDSYLMAAAYMYRAGWLVLLARYHGTFGPTGLRMASSYLVHARPGPFQVIDLR